MNREGKSKAEVGIRNPVSRRSMAVQLCSDPLQAQKEGTFDSPGLRPRWDLIFRVRGTPPQEEPKWDFRPHPQDKRGVGQDAKTKFITARIDRSQARNGRSGRVAVTDFGELSPAITVSGRSRLGAGGVVA